MRAEDKELEGPELAHEQTREDEREATQEELPEATQDVQDLQLASRSQLLDALRLILAGEQVNLTLLYLPQRETHALEALQAAVTGNDSVGEFVFAEDRRVLLEQALAVLQQNLTHGEPAQLAELQSKFDAMTEQVGELREALSDLEDAQEQIDEFHNAARELLSGAGDKDDEDKPKPDAKPEVAPEQAEKGEKPGLLGFLSGVLGRGKRETDAPKPSEPAKPSSLMDGPEVEHAPKRSSLYDPDDVPPEAATETYDPSPQRRKIVPKPEPPKR